MPVAAIDHNMRVFLLAKATAALLHPRRSISPCSHRLKASVLLAQCFKWGRQKDFLLFQSFEMVTCYALGYISSIYAHLLVNRLMGD